MKRRIIEDKVKDTSLDELFEETPQQKPRLVYHDAKQPLLKINNTKESSPIIKYAIEAVVGVFLLYFGVFNMSSMFSTSTMLSGYLAQVFYLWQVGPILEVVGCILIYDAIKSSYDIIKSIIQSYITKVETSGTDRRRGI